MGINSLKTKMTIYFLCISLIPVVIVGAYAGMLVINSLRDNSQVFAETAVEKTASELDTILANPVNVATIITHDTSIRALIDSPLPSAMARRDEITLYLDSQLDSIRQQNYDIFAIYLICENSAVYRSGYHAVRDVEFRSEQWYMDVLALPTEENVWFDPHVGSFITDTVGDDFISVAKSIEDPVTGEKLGVVMVDIETQIVREILDSDYLNEGYTLLLNDNGDPVVYPPDIDTAETVTIYNVILTESEDYLVTMHSSDISHFKTAGIVPYNYILRDSVTVISIVVLLTVLIVVITVSIIFKVVRSISEPIVNLSKLMKQATAGDLHVRMDKETDDEVGVLVESFNIMISEIDRFTSKEIEDLKRLRTSELNALQAQINPHFLYNTLDSIVWAARAGNDKTVISMVTALTKFFRIALSKGRDIISVREELEHIRSYLVIQSLRYESMLGYDIDVNPEYYGYRTIKLLLQPLVENAIYHGIKLRETKGHISISAHDDEHNIYIVVTDNGPGMTADKLAELNLACKSKEGERIDSYGVINVCKRMSILFGEEYTLSYTGAEGEGTAVTLPIPKHLNEAHSDFQAQF